MTLRLLADGAWRRPDYLDPMHKHPLHQPRASTRSPAQLFADLRERNEYMSRVTQMLRAQRLRRIEHVMQAQRRHRLHNAP